MISVLHDIIRLWYHIWYHLWYWPWCHLWYHSQPAAPPLPRSCQMANQMAIKWFQCEYTLLHRQAWQRRGAELGSGEERTGALMSWMVLLEVEQAACMKSQLSWAPLAKGCGVVTRSYHEAINIRRRPPSTLSIISAGTQLSLTLNQLVTQLSLSPQLREQKKHTLHPVKNIAPRDARRCTLSQSRTSPRESRDDAH